MGIMTVKEAAQKWGVSTRRISEYLRAGRIEGAYKIGFIWVIPDDAQKPPKIPPGKKKTG